jgi:hypothetical protein
MENDNNVTVCGPEPVSVKYIRSLRVQFRPLKDITAYELAEAIPYIFSGYAMPDEIKKNESLFRHFIVEEY